MFAVAFEVLPSETGYQRYLDIAAALRPKLDLIDGFLSIERFRCLSHPGWILSLSLWRDEAALVRWRGDGEHHAAQSQGREAIFNDYRIRVVRMTQQPQEEPGPLVGFWEYPAEAIPVPCKHYQSLVDPGKQIAQFDFSDGTSAAEWQARTAAQAAPAARVLRGTVLRDYGLFERAQAPQVFPDAVR